MFSKINAIRSAAAASMLGLVASSHAALPAGAEAKIAEVGTDVTTAVGYVTLAGLAIYAAKKLGQKMGWL
jgi:hypothetical protein